MGKGKKNAKKESRVRKSKQVGEEDEVDYAATADAFFSKGSDEDESADEGVIEKSEIRESDGEHAGVSSTSDDSGDSDEEEYKDGTKETIKSSKAVDQAVDSSENDEDDASEMEEEKADEGNQIDSSASNEDDSEANESADDDEDEDEESDDDDVDYEEEEAENQKEFVQPSSAMGEPCSFDLRNLMGINSHQINGSSLYSPIKKNLEKDREDENFTIPSNLDVVVNEDYLLQKASDGASQLIAALWQLPVQRSDAGPMVMLPHYEEMKIPRALPPPPPKAETKWEKFAKAKGIPLNKEKRSRKVWDEVKGEWLYRHGYEKANDKAQEWPIMEVKEGQDPFEDPWQRQREAKRSRIDKNTESRMKNQERAGALPKGTSRKVMKNLSRTRETGKGSSERDAPPVGVPVDLKPAKGNNEKIHPAKRGKESTLAALQATQRSTASLGKFDKMREGEPERKKALSSLKKRKFESATDKKVIATEAERSLKLLKTVVEGGGVEKEKARRKGKLAKGETAYDYEYDDGLGPSTFRKKKGRAGSGKLKKMTKKRVK